ncbi:cytochrome c oxidase subunit 3, partial [Singulisphaera rosea]
GLLFGVSEDAAKKVLDRLVAAGAEAEVVPLATFNWPRPYDFMTNPLSIDLTAANTFILICSSLTMVFALSAFQQNERRKGTLLLLATALIGATFLGVQVYEYYQLWEGHHYPPGVSASGHFRPNVSLFASCFFTMTGFHGAHVAAGVIMLVCITLRSAFTGAYHRSHYSPVELVGLYWHFVDLVWIILFTVVYLI